MANNYVKSHPWITFSLDTREAKLFTWMRLGEIQSKCQHIAGSLLDPETAAKFYYIYLAKGALATTAIEGNTLSEEQVGHLLKGTLSLPKSKEYLRQEVDNIIAACNEIANSLFQGNSSQLSVQEI
jgi:hypothetical protein